MAAVMPIYHLTWHACPKEPKIVHDFNSEYAVHNVMGSSTSRYIINCAKEKYTNIIRYITGDLISN